MKIIYDAAKFWSKVKKTPDCWLWQGMTNGDGYGLVRQYHGRRSHETRAHRFAYELIVGPIPEGLFVCHKCDVRNCVNPDHLFLGTNTENMQDAASKQRVPHGTKHYRTKLTEDDVRDIRKASARGATRREVAERFGVSTQAIFSIATGRTWRHVK
jgi:hypothetical protein